MKVVMVDDSQADRKLCRMLFEEALGPRLEFREANSAAAGLKMCREASPDCILLVRARPVRRHRVPDLITRLPIPPLPDSQ